MERANRGRGTIVLKNQLYDESLEVVDSEEVASVRSPTPRSQRQVTVNNTGGANKKLNDGNIILMLLVNDFAC